MGFYTESAKQLINPVSIPDFLMECAHIDNVLFEGLIELDFAECYNESGNIVLTEEEQQEGEKTAKVAIGESIKKIWDKFVETLKGIFSKISAALDKFFSETTSIVSSKVIADEKAKSCTTKDIWYLDYVDKVRDIVMLRTYDEFWGSLSKYATDALEGKISIDDLMEKTAEATTKVNSFDKYPTTVEENENAESEYKIEVVELGSKSASFKSLQKDLSPAGIALDVKAVFSKLKTPDELLRTIEKETSKEDKKANKAYNAVMTKSALPFKLTVMSMTGKCVSKALKIARRNYKEIAAAVKGKEVKASEKETNEAVFVAAQFSDLFCESVFEF